MVVFKIGGYLSSSYSMSMIQGIMVGVFVESPFIVLRTAFVVAFSFWAFFLIVSVEYELARLLMRYLQ